MIGVQVSPSKRGLSRSLCGMILGALEGVKDPRTAQTVGGMTGLVRSPM